MDLLLYPPAMSAAETTYWATVAQVFPVFGLALVLEARTLIQAWQKQGGPLRGVHRGQILILIVAGLGVLTGTSIALASLQVGESPDPWADVTINVSLGAALGGTMLTPLVTILLHTESGFLARLSGLSRSRALRRMWRELNRMQRRVTRIRINAFKQMTECESILQTDHESLAGDRLAVDHDRHRRTLARIAKAETLLCEVRERWRGVIVYEQNLRVLFREVKRASTDWSREEREQLAATLQRSQDPIGGPAGSAGFTSRRTTDAVGGSSRSASLTFQRQAPDDGGFLWPDPSTFAFPDIDPKTEKGFITDPAVFYETDD